MATGAASFKRLLGGSVFDITVSAPHADKYESPPTWGQARPLAAFGASQECVEGTVCNDDQGKEPSDRGNSEWVASGSYDGKEGGDGGENDE
jgi:hypothetical protein